MSRLVNSQPIRGTGTGGEEDKISPRGKKIASFLDKSIDLGEELQVKDDFLTRIVELERKLQIANSENLWLEQKNQRLKEEVERLNQFDNSEISKVLDNLRELRAKNEYLEKEINKMTLKPNISAFHSDSYLDPIPYEQSNEKRLIVLVDVQDQSESKFDIGEPKFEFEVKEDRNAGEAKSTIKFAFREYQRLGYLGPIEKHYLLEVNHRNSTSDQPEYALYKKIDMQSAQISSCVQKATKPIFDDFCMGERSSKPLSHIVYTEIIESVIKEILRMNWDEKFFENPVVGNKSNCLSMPPEEIHNIIDNLEKDNLEILSPVGINNWKPKFERERSKEVISRGVSREVGEGYRQRQMLGSVGKQEIRTGETKAFAEARQPQFKSTLALSAIDPLSSENLTNHNSTNIINQNLEVEMIKRQMKKLEQEISKKNSVIEQFEKAIMLAPRSLSRPSQHAVTPRIVEPDTRPTRALDVALKTPPGINFSSKLTDVEKHIINHVTKNLTPVPNVPWAKGHKGLVTCAVGLTDCEGKTEETRNDYRAIAVTTHTTKHNLTLYEISDLKRKAITSNSLSLDRRLQQSVMDVYMCNHLYIVAYGGVGIDSVIEINYTNHPEPFEPAQYFKPWMINGTQKQRIPKNGSVIYVDSHFLYFITLDDRVHFVDLDSFPLETGFIKFNLIRGDHLQVIAVQGDMIWGATEFGYIHRRSIEEGKEASSLIGSFAITALRVHKNFVFYANIDDEYKIGEGVVCFGVLNKYLNKIDNLTVQSCSRCIRDLAIVKPPSHRFGQIDGVLLVLLPDADDGQLPIYYFSGKVLHQVMILDSWWPNMRITYIKEADNAILACGEATGGARGGQHPFEANVAFIRLFKDNF